MEGEMYEQEEEEEEENQDELYPIRQKIEAIKNACRTM